uniref:DnaJ n=1 Tax=Solanum tuberosum TaxID=4113 RepID=M1CB79_SOLTU
MVKEESLEDLQRTFVDMFGGDLAKMMGDGTSTAKKRARDSGCSKRAASKRNNVTNVNFNGTC